MSLKLKEIPKGGKEFPRLADDTYLARIVSVIDLGLQAQTDWKTKEPIDPKRQVMITYETPDELVEYTDKEGNEVKRPHHVTKSYTLSMSEMSALYKLIQAIKPDCETLDELINTPCMITIGSTSTGNAKITAVNKPMKGIVVPELQNDTKYFDFDNPVLDLFNSVHEWQQKIIKDALDFPDSPLDKLLNSPADY